MKKTIKKTILVVDDDRAVRDVVKQILVAKGYEVVTASDGKEGFVTFQETPDFDLVIMDMTMPEWNGNKTFHEMRGVKPDVRVLFITGYDKTETLPELLNMGAVGCLTKPFNMESLIDRVRIAIR